MKKLKVIHISDTHGFIPNIDKFPCGDILIYSGDADCNPNYHKNNLAKLTPCLEELNDFFQDLLDKKKFKKIIFVPGNHDFIFQNFEVEARYILNAATVLIDEEYEYGGFKFYGSPQTPAFCDWSFNRTQDELKEIWKDIPSDTDILVTHGPPQGILDQTGRGLNEHLGCPALALRITQLKLKLHCYGHIHGGGNSIIDINGTTFSNASIMDESYSPTQSYNEFELTSKNGNSSEDI